MSEDVPVLRPAPAAEMEQPDLKPEDTKESPVRFTVKFPELYDEEDPPPPAYTPACRGEPNSVHRPVRKERTWESLDHHHARYRAGSEPRYLPRYPDNYRPPEDSRLRSVKGDSQAKYRAGSE